MSPAPVTAWTGMGSAADPASRQGGLDPRGESRHNHSTIASRSAPAPLQDGGAASPPTASVVPSGAISAGEAAHGSQIVQPLPAVPRLVPEVRAGRGQPAELQLSGEGGGTALLRRGGEAARRDTARDASLL